jgi:hypothetical protein
VPVAARIIALADIGTSHSPQSIKEMSLRGSSNSLFTKFWAR